MASQKYIEYIGWAASLLGILMFLSYFDQIRLNISGAKGSLVLPLVTVINCILWILYGYFRNMKPILWANIVGLIMSLGAVFSWFY